MCLASKSEPININLSATTTYRLYKYEQFSYQHVGLITKIGFFTQYILKKELKLYKPIL